MDVRPSTISRAASVDAMPAAGGDAPIYTRILAETPDAESIERLINTEWLLTSGLGGFAMGSVLGVPTRRYHGLLVAEAPGSPIRCMLLNALLDQVHIDAGKPTQEIHDLSTFEFAGEGGTVLHPRGHARLVRFEKDVALRWVYRLGEIEIVKQVVLPRLSRTVQVKYTIAGPAGELRRVRLAIRPLVALRDFHTLRRAYNAPHFEVGPVAGLSGAAGAVRVAIADTPADLHIASDAASFWHQPQWWYNLHYRADARRGQDCIEDLFSPGLFTWEPPLKTRRAERAVTIQASAAGPGAGPEPIREFATEEYQRRRHVMQLIANTTQRLTAGVRSLDEPDAATLAKLVAASDDFVVQRDRPGAAQSQPPPAQGKRATKLPATRDVTVIAGYPWFNDWGRDTTISIPGLMLATGRYAEALAALRRFAAHMQRGIVPNRFGDASGEPEYNTVDASLWFIIAATSYLTQSGDRAGFTKHLAPACLAIIEAYRAGTDHNIAQDPSDLLIAAGTSATQLTWMDARRDGVVFTPRFGKPVEINALWCSALALLAEALTRESATTAADLRSHAEAAAKSFRTSFWDAQTSTCFDVLLPPEGNANAAAGRWIGVRECRPNQVFAVSLPHSPLARDQQGALLKAVRERLVAGAGVRTLAAGEPGYRGRFRGNLFELDAAYHNGTAWPWLLGPVAEATLRVGGFSKAARAEASELLRPLIALLDAHCLGQLPEVLDGDDSPREPQLPGGCPAQAWSVAEALRVWALILADDARQEG